MTTNCIYSHAIDGIFPPQHEFYEDQFTEPNRNVEAYMEMTEMEYMYFTSDDLEYNPNDWVPINDSNTDTLSTTESDALLEIILLLINTICDEAPPADTRPHSPMRPLSRSDARDCFTSIVWHDDMPTAYPVCQDEYCEYINQYGTGFTMIQSIEETPNVIVHQNTAVVQEKTKLSNRHKLPKKKRASAKKIPHGKTRSIGGNFSININMKHSTSHTLPKKESNIKKVPHYKTQSIDWNCSINARKKRVDVSVRSKPQKPRKPLISIMNRNKVTKRAT